MVFRNILLLIIILVISGCKALWPYSRDFDCPVAEGHKCKSLYEISEMADKGMFGPDSIKVKKIVNKKRGCSCAG